MGVTSVLHRIVELLHILAAIVSFGGLIVHGAYNANDYKGRRLLGPTMDEKEPMTDQSTEQTDGNTDSNTENEAGREAASSVEAESERISEEAPAKVDAELKEEL
jgi:hypothetical protein